MADRDPLLDFVSSVSGDRFLKVEEDLGEGFVRLKTSEAERRQAKHDIRSVEDVVIELLRNSRDAHSSRIYVATTRDGDVRRLAILDDGVGIPAALQDRVFDPRVTSKLETMSADRWGVHGRGMALFSIRSNAEEAKVTLSEPHRGTAVSVIADTTELPEKADQSTWPVVETDDDGAPQVVRGPHNIVRRVVEFACDHPDLKVYVGTPTEIVGSLVAHAKRAIGSAELAFCDDMARLPLWQRPVACGDASELVEVAASMGLPVSERTAHRVMASEVPPLEPVLSQVLQTKPDVTRPPVDIYRDRRGLQIHHSDIEEFRRALHQAFDVIADKYYLSVVGEPHITVGRDEIRVRFSVEKED